MGEGKKKSLGIRLVACESKVYFHRHVSKQQGKKKNEV